MQQKTFTKWVNLQLGKIGDTIADLEKDFETGLHLINLAEVLSGEKVKIKPMKAPKLRIQKVQNINGGLDIFKARIRLDGISAEDICDGNLKLILGMIWTIISLFDIADISEEELSAKDALLLWCQKKTKKYNNVAVDNFHRSWKDGLAFCALIHAHRPDLIPYETLTRGNDAENLELAFKVAEEQLGIPRFLDVVDMVESEKPDERSVMTYVSQYYKYFAAGSKNDTAARRIKNIIEAERRNAAMKEEYATRSRQLAEWIANKTNYLNTNMVSNGTLEDTRAKLNELNEYQRSEKPPKAAEKLDLEALLQSLALQLRQANRPPFVPEVSTDEIERLWTLLEEAERVRLAALNDDEARLAKLKNLLSRFERKAAALEAWQSEKGAYLAEREDITSLSAARSALKIHDAYDVEKTKADPRRDVVQQLADEILALNYADAEAVRTRMANINAAHADLGVNGKAKSDYLWECVEREETKDALRQEFADKAKAYVAFTRTTALTVEDTTFGNDLQTVEAFGPTLETDDANISSEDESKLNEIKRVADEMAKLGVTDNKYTALTVDDCEHAHGIVEKAKQSRREAYQAELERQRAMEAHRVKFAEEAQAFIDAVDAEGQALVAMTGEPDEVLGSIDGVHQNGAPLGARFDALVALDAESRRLRITSNPHTKITVPKARSKLNAHKIAIKNFVHDLKEERALKQSYATRAAELMAWIQATIPTMKDMSALDNTLEGARAALAAFNAYRTNDKGPKAAVRVELISLCDTIKAALAQSAFTRPAFVAPEGCSIEDINAAWDVLTAAEDEKDAAVQDEVFRQERMAQLVRRFNGDREELLAWIEQQEAYLAREEAVGSVTSAQVQIAVLAGFRKDYTKRKDRKDHIASYVAELTKLNYGEIASIDASFTELNERFGALDGAAGDKQAKLDAALALEQEKDTARATFAKRAADYVRWARDTADDVADTAFGYSLEEVESFGATLDAQDAQITGDNAAKKGDVDAAVAQLTALNTTSTSGLSEADLAAESERVSGALASRRSAYDAELQKQRELEAKAVEFGTVAAAFVAWLASQTDQLNGVSGSLDEREAAIKGIYADGAPADAEFAKVQAVDAEATQMGVTHSRSEHSYKQVEAKLQSFVKLARSKLASLEEERAVAERAAMQAAASANAEHIESLRIDYLSTASALNAWLDNLKEATSEPLAELTTVQGAAEQQALFDEAVSTLESQKKAYENVNKLAAELTAANQSHGSLPVEMVKAKWDESVTHIEARRGELVEAAQKQAAHEAVRQQFAEAARDVDVWTDEKMAALATTPRQDLQAQLAAAKAVQEEAATLGRQKLARLQEINGHLERESIPMVVAKSCAALTAEYEAVVAAASKKVADVNASIARAASMQITPEQLAEFTGVFNHFDKSGRGALNKLEFKGCMQSLGEDLSDSKLDSLMNSTDANGNRTIELQEFVAYMATQAVDTDSDDQLVAAFATVTDGKDTITEPQMLQVLSADEVEYLKGVMPRAEDGSYRYKDYVRQVFASTNS